MFAHLHAEYLHSFMAISVLSIGTLSPSDNNTKIPTITTITKKTEICLAQMRSGREKNDKENHIIQWLPLDYGWYWGTRWAKLRYPNCAKLELKIKNSNNFPLLCPSFLFFFLFGWMFARVSKSLLILFYFGFFRISFLLDVINVVMCNGRWCFKINKVFPIFCCASLQPETWSLVMLFYIYFIFCFAAKLTFACFLCILLCRICAKSFPGANSLFEVSIEYLRVCV